MISGPRVNVKIGGRTFNVPRYKDEDTTYHLAKLLHARIQEIESRSSRIDTQAFAIEAAMSFAFDLLEAEETLSTETKEMMSSLGDLSNDLQAICRDFDVDIPEEEQ